MSKKIRYSQRDIDNPKRRQRFCKAHSEKLIGHDYGFPVPILLEKIMDEIVEYATKAGIDSYYLLRHYQFSDEEIEGYFESLGRDAIY